MYPYLRLALELARARRMAPLALDAPHVSRHTCLPWDVDPWRELNNGRALTLYDLGRVPYGLRLGLGKALAANGWGMVVAGASVRYRRRVRAFDRIEMHTRAIGWDARFLYVEQAMWLKGEAAGHILIRSAVTGREGIVAPSRLVAALDGPEQSPPLPQWVQDWIAAEGERPWPPEQAPRGRFED